MDDMTRGGGSLTRSGEGSALPHDPLYTLVPEKKAWKGVMGVWTEQLEDLEVICFCSSSIPPPPLGGWLDLWSGPPPPHEARDTKRTSYVRGSVADALLPAPRLATRRC
jgi:hypothetical protein